MLGWSLQQSREWKRVRWDRCKILKHFWIVCSLLLIPGNYRSNSRNS
jgi:hypothetical protein